MADQFSPNERSRIMARVKSKNTHPERVVRSLLHKAGFRFRLHRDDLPGKPDIVFPSRKKAIFVHGCFWHSHTCRHGSHAPASNTEYWSKKLAANKVRDISNLDALIARGWTPLIVWECEIRHPDDLLARLVSELNG